MPGSEAGSSRATSSGGGAAVDTLSGLLAAATNTTAGMINGVATQTTVLMDAAVQCEPPTAAAEELRRVALSPELALFLHEAVPLCEEALQQNELVDVLADELAGLVDEDAGEGQPAGCNGRSARAGLLEHFSFSDLQHSKGKVLATVQWHPSRRGVVAVACIHPQQQMLPPSQHHVDAKAATLGGHGAPSGSVAGSYYGQQHQQRHGLVVASIPRNLDFLRQPPTGCILVWNQADTIQPEAVLQAPAEVLALAFHPTQPHILAAGMNTGQVALFNLQQQQQQQQPAADALASARAHEPASVLSCAVAVSTAAIANAVSSAVQNQHHGGVGGPGGGHGPPDSEGREDNSKTIELLPSFVSLPEASHHAAITHLEWLPGVVVSRDGKFEAAPGKEGEGAKDSSSTAGACTLFATTAIDGRLLLWDMRITIKQRKTAAKEEEQPDWKPVMSLGATNSAKQPLLATCFCRDMRWGAGRFVLGSLEGELAVADSTTHSSERKGNLEWGHNTVHRVVGHTGRVATVAFSPFFSDMLLAVGDTGFVVWRLLGNGGNKDSSTEGSAGRQSSKDGTQAATRESGKGQGDEAAATSLPVFRSPYSDVLYMCGCWSPSKPGTIILGRQDGRLEVWDLLDRTHQPAVVAPVTPCAVTALALLPQPPPSGSRSASLHLLAVGDAAGTLHLLELPRALRRRGRAEVTSMAALLQREEERLGVVACRAEARLAEKRAEAERQRAVEAATQSAARQQQQQQQRQEAKGIKEAQEVTEQSAEERYLAMEAEWRAKLLGTAGEAAAVEN